MIVMLALLNDGAILSIAYDNVHYKDQPEAWNMRLVLGLHGDGISASQPRLAVLSGRPRLHLDPARIQTLMYLKLSVQGISRSSSRARAGPSGPYVRRGYC